MARHSTTVRAEYRRLPTHRERMTARRQEQRLRVAFWVNNSHSAKFIKESLAKFRQQNADHGVGSRARRVAVMGATRP